MHKKTERVNGSFTGLLVCIGQSKGMANVVNWRNLLVGKLKKWTKTAHTSGWCQHTPTHHCADLWAYENLSLWWWV